MGQPIIFRNVTKRSAKRRILDDCSFSVSDGELCGIIGASGSGKTSILKHIAGIYKPDSGEVIVNGQSVKGIVSDIGFAFQDVSLYEELTAEENLHYFGKFYGVKGLKDRVSQLLSMVLLEKHKNVPLEKMSGGMRKRVEIACSLINSPRLVVMDEPMAGLDPHLQDEIWQLINRINSSGITVVISTHHLEDAESRFSNLVIVKNGKVIFSGPAGQARREFSLFDEIHLKASPGRYEDIVKELRSFSEVADAKIADGGLIVYSADRGKAISLISRILRERDEHIIDINIHKQGLGGVLKNEAS